MAPVEERPSSVYDELRPRESLIGAGILLVTLVLWMAVVSPPIGDQAPWAATPWPPLVLGLVGVSIYFFKRQRQELAEAGIERVRSRRVVRQALRTGRLPDDRSHDDEIRARVTYARVRTGELTRRLWVIVLVLGAMSLTRGLLNHDVFDLVFAVVCVAMAPVTWWLAPRTIAKWDRLDADLDARSPAEPEV